MRPARPGPASMHYTGVRGPRASGVAAAVAGDSDVLFGDGTPPLVNAS
jgi:hypothetical protein